MSQYIKRPDITNAIQFRGDNHSLVIDFMILHSIPYDAVSLNYTGSSFDPTLIIKYIDEKVEMKFSDYLVVDFNSALNEKVVSFQTKSVFERKFQKYEG